MIPSDVMEENAFSCVGGLFYFIFSQKKPKMVQREGEQEFQVNSAEDLCSIFWAPYVLRVPSLK